MADMIQGQGGDVTTNRSQALQGLIGKSPSVLGGTLSNQSNQAAVSQQNQIQQTVSGGTQASAGAIQAAAGQQAAQKGQAAVQAAGQANQQIAQQGALAQQDVQAQQRTNLAKSSLELDKQSNGLANQLNDLQRGLKNELFDKQMDFQTDELGRTLWNDRQLMDYALSTAKSEEELAQWQDDMTYYSNVRLQVLQASEQKILQAAEQASKNGEFEKDANLKIYLAQKAVEVKKKIQEEQNRQRNRSAMFSAGGTIVGAGIGSIGGPAGAAAGASVGGALGQVAASQSE